MTDLLKSSALVRTPVAARKLIVRAVHANTREQAHVPLANVDKAWMACTFTDSSSAASGEPD